MTTMTTRNSSSVRTTRWNPPHRPATERIHIEYMDNVAESVALAGTFNEWRPEATPMIAVGEGRWVKDLTLPRGIYEYCFVVDGIKWAPDPQATESAPNPFGGVNSVLRVGGSSGSTQRQAS